MLDPTVYSYGHTPVAKYTGDPTIRFVEPYYYMMHSETTDERWVIGGTGYADFIVRSKNLSVWEESLCSDGEGGSRMLFSIRCSSKMIAASCCCTMTFLR